MLHLGDDFTEFSETDFEAVDKAIKYFNDNPTHNLNLFFSTPDKYINAI